MRRLILVAAISFIVALPALATTAKTAHVVLTISGMYCEGCATGIKAMLERTAGVVSAGVSYDAQRATIEYNPNKTTPAKIISTVRKMGYKASIKS